MKLNSLLFLSLFVLAGCKSPEYLSRPVDFRHHVKGLFLEAQLANGQQLLAEIIEVVHDEIVLLPVGQNIGIQTISKDTIQTAEVMVSLTSDSPQAIGGWAGLINLLSIGHGFFGTLSLPINIVAGAAVANRVAKLTYRVKYPEQISWEGMKKFARFPQGIPNDIEREEIR